jgi:hypothetical protein
MAKINGFPGLNTRGDPRDIEPGAAQVQENWQSVSPGELTIRKGLQIHAFTTTITITDDILAMYTYLTPNARYCAMLTSNGDVYYGNSTDATIETGVSIYRPSCWAQTRHGRLIRVNGLQRGSIYGIPTASDNGEVVLSQLGITAPAAAPTAVAHGTGTNINGTYLCAYRYRDAAYNYSNLSPAATVTTAGNDHIDWSALTLSANPRVVAIELFRTTDAESTTYYHAATEANTGTPTHEDTMTDAQLIANTALPVLNDDGTLNANRFDPPPTDCEVAVAFQDRVFYLVTTPISLDDYNTNVTDADTQIVGKYIYRDGYVSESVVSVTSGPTYVLSITGSETAADLITAGAYVCCEPENRNRVFYSEIDEPESAAVAQNVINIQENVGDPDYLTGAAPFGSCLYLFKQRHTYRMTYAVQPVIDANVHLVCGRGCLNQRCWTMLGDALYVLDCWGVWRLTNNGYESISEPIGNYWSDQTIDFAKGAWFFASCETNLNVIRFHVAFTGDSGARPKRALVFCPETKAWWTENYSQMLGGTATSEETTGLRCLVGGENGNVYVTDEDPCDVVATAITGTATASGSSTLTDSTKTFTDSIIGAPVCISFGTGEGQTRIIASRNSATQFTVDAAWTTNPDTTSRYIIGGIQATYRTGMFELPDATNDGAKRSVIVAYKPTTAETTVNLNLWYDDESAAESMNISEVKAGVSTTAGSEDIAINMKKARSTLANAPGYAKVPVHVRANTSLLNHRCLAVGLECYGGSEAVKIHDLDLE